MNPILDRTVRLAVICSIAALFLGVTNSITAPEIEQHKVENLKRALGELVISGEAGAVESVVDTYVYERYPVTESNELKGYILGINGNGYGGEMKLLASYSLDGTLQKAILMENNETPGLGRKAEKSEYMEKFLGKGNRNSPIPTSKGDLEKPDAVGGSTITFNGVSQALSRGAAYVREELK